MFELLIDNKGVEMFLPGNVSGRSLSQFAVHAGTKYGQRYTITLIPGDGTGKELTESIKKVFRAVNAPIDWEEVAMSGYCDSDETSRLRQAIESVKRNKIALKGLANLLTILKL